MQQPRAVARSSLRWSAAYCALAGSLAVVFAAPLGSHLGLPAWLTALLGFGVIAWAGLVWGFARSDEWWGPTAMVSGVNLGAAAMLAAWAMSTGGPGGAVLGLGAAQVLAFAVLQGIALALGWRDRVG